MPRDAPPSEARHFVVTEDSEPGLPEAASRIDVERPSTGEQILASSVGDYEVRVRSEDLVGVLVSLDGARPRRARLERGLRLAELMPEHEAVPEGAHVLLVAREDPQGRVYRARGQDGRRPWEVVAFRVGERTEPHAPRLFCLSPTGTYYGMPESGLRLELIAVAEPSSGKRARLRIEGGGLAELVEVDPGRPHRIRGLPLGDVRITDIDHPGSPACVATLNPERVP